MNSQYLQKQLFEAVVEILERAELDPKFPKATGGADFEVQVDGLRFAVECEKNPRPSRVSPPPKSLTSGDRIPVKGIPVAGKRLTDALSKLGWNWFDAAGNCRLAAPGRFLIECSGNSPVIKMPPGRLNLSTPETNHLMRALLVPEHAGRSWSQRELSEACDPQVSLGLTNKVVRELREEGFLVGDGPVQVTDPEGLLAAWTEKYRFDRNIIHSAFTLLKPGEIHRRLTSLEAEQPMVCRFAHASFSAADFQAPNVRQPVIWLYSAFGEEDILMQRLEAKAVDSGANLRILVAGDKGVFFNHDVAEGRLRATNPLQTYVDLMHCGGRGAEAAEAILRQCLKPAWEKKT